MYDVRQAWRRFRSTRGLKREALTLLLGLALGVILMPPLIWLVGSRTLGAYANGSPWAFGRDFFTALFKGSLPYVAVALGPYVAVWGWRALRAALRS